MANTTIQLKYGLVTAAPTALNVAEPAYSYSSNTFFIGSPDGTGVVAVGGKFYLDQQQTIFNQGNSAFAQANSAAAYANSAFLAANNASDLWVRNHANGAFAAANSAGSYANSGFTQANTATTNAATADVKAVSAGTYANGAFLQANTATTDAATADGKAVTADAKAVNAGGYANSAFGVANTASSTATSAAAYANGAFAAANTKFASAGGTITGDVNITANLTVSGQVTYANTTTVNLGDNIITLNADIGQSSIPTEDAGFEIDRGAKGNSSFLWIESSEKWSANNGNTAFYVGAESDGVYANGAFAAANTASSTGTAAGSYANSAFSVANSATTSAATADAKAVSAGSYANSAFLLANGASFVANTDFTNLTITAADHGSASAVAAFRVEANGRISSANSTAIAIAASAITSGTLGVTRGGTGAGTFTSSGVLLGAGTSAFTTASSSTEGHVLTINASGVPTFSHLQGGTF